MVFYSEQEYEIVPLSTMIERFPFYGRVVLCNNVVKVDKELLCTMCENYLEHNDCSAEDFTLPDVTQFLITNLSVGDAEYLLDNVPGIMLGYSEVLDAFIVGIESFGSSWDDIWYHIRKEV